MDHLNSIYNAARKAAGGADDHDSLLKSAHEVEKFIKEHSPETVEKDPEKK